MKSLVCVLVFICNSFALHCLHLTMGSYVGEMYSNSLWYSSDSLEYRGIVYTPDYGRTLEVTYELDNPQVNQFLKGNISEFDDPGSFLLHYSASYDSRLLKFINYGHSFYYLGVMVDLAAYDNIISGWSDNELYLVDCQSAGSILYISNANVQNITQINSFPNRYIHQIKRGSSTGEVYMLAKNLVNDSLCILYSNNSCISFSEHNVAAAVQANTDIHWFNLIPIDAGRIYLAHNQQTVTDGYDLYYSDDWGQHCTLTWNSVLPLNKSVTIIPVYSNDNVDLIMEELVFNEGDFCRLNYLISCDNGVSFTPTGNHIISQSYINPIYLVPTPEDNPISADATGTIIHVRSNADWNVSTDSGWINNISQVNGTGHSDITLTITPNTTGTDRTASLNFISNNAPDTTIVITQSGEVGNSDDVIIPDKPIMLACYPNPFMNGTTISFSLEKASPASIEIYNIKGQLIKLLCNDMYSKGINITTWDGKNKEGKPAGSGIYLIRLKAGNKVISKKAIMLK